MRLWISSLNLIWLKSYLILIQWDFWGTRWLDIIESRLLWCYIKL
jgi:hypothetical protein